MTDQLSHLAGKAVEAEAYAAVLLEVAKAESSDARAAVFRKASDLIATLIKEKREMEEKATLWKDLHDAAALGASLLMEERGVRPNNSTEDFRRGIEAAAQWHEDMFRNKIGADKTATPEQADKFMSRLLWHSWASAALRAFALTPSSPGESP